MSSTVEQIKAKLSITDVIGGYLKLERAGVNLKARCPFHNERTPSFYVSPGRQSFHCFGCNKGGDIFSFVEEIEGVTFVDALKLLAEKAGVQIQTTDISRKEQSEKEKLRMILADSVEFYAKNLQSGEYAIAKKYLIDRGVKEETIKRFSIGFAPNEWRLLATHLKNKGFSDADADKAGLLLSSPKGYYDRFRGRIMFPIFDVSGHPIGFSARILPGIKLPSGEEPAKYINTAQTLLYDKSKAMYGIHLAKNSMRQNDRVILVEGQMDTVMSSQAGVTEVVAVSGTALTTDHIQLIRRFTDNIIVVLDSDDAGFKAAARSVGMAYSAGMQVRALTLPSGKDPADFVLGNPEKWKDLIDKAVPFVDFAIEELYRKYSDTRERTKAIREFLYPYLRMIKLPLEREEGLRRISENLNLGLDAVREDFTLWAQQTPSNETTTDSQETKDNNISTSIVENRSAKIFTRLIGIYFLQKGVPKPVENAKNILDRLKEQIDGLPGQNLSAPNEYSFEPTEDEKIKYIFEAEQYYGSDSSLEAEIEHLLKEFAIEVLRERLARAVTILRNAEKNSNSSSLNSDELLSLCRDISNELTSRQHKR